MGIFHDLRVTMGRIHEFQMPGGKPMCDHLKGFFKLHFHGYEFMDTLCAV